MDQMFTVSVYCTLGNLLDRYPNQYQSEIWKYIDATCNRAVDPHGNFGPKGEMPIGKIVIAVQRPELDDQS